MSLLNILAIAVGLSLDACAVAVASSVALGRVTARQVFRFGFHFGLFQAVMPVIGWAAGRTVEQQIKQWDHWVAFVLLSFVGCRALYEACREKTAGTRGPVSDPTRGFSLVMLSTATSIDALAVGLSFAFLEVRIWYPAVIIGLVTGTLTVLGMLFGNRIGLRFGRRMEVVGGLVLIGIGIKILVEHLTI